MRFHLPLTRARTRALELTDDLRSGLKVAACGESMFFFFVFFSSNGHLMGILHVINDIFHSLCPCFQDMGPVSMPSVPLMVGCGVSCTALVILLLIYAAFWRYTPVLRLDLFSDVAS